MALSHTVQSMALLFCNSLIKGGEILQRREEKSFLARGEAFHGVIVTGTLDAADVWCNNDPTAARCSKGFEPWTMKL